MRIANYAAQRLLWVIFDRSSQLCPAVYVGFAPKADIRLGQAGSNEADQQLAQGF
jgi:hypothetical protein